MGPNDKSVIGKPLSTTRLKRSCFKGPIFKMFHEFFNNNVHNCMVASGTSSNVIPFSVCQKLNVDPKKSNKNCTTRPLQSQGLGEMRNVLIRLSINSQVHQTIDILVVDTPEAYGLLLSKDLSSQLNGYFSTNWSNLWLPYKEKPNQI